MKKRVEQSRADFIHKVGIANKEMREAHYWLRLAQDAELVVTNEVEALVHEANELIAILTSSIKTAKQRDTTPFGSREVEEFGGKLAWSWTWSQRNRE